METSPLIVIAAPLGYYARNLLRSGVLDRLLEADPRATAVGGVPPSTADGHGGGIRVAIASPASEDPAFRREFQRNGQVRFAPLHAIPTQLTWPERALWKARYTVRRSRALSMRMDALVQRAYLRWGRRYYADFLDQERPSLVVTGSPGFHSNKDAPLIREAQARGIPTLCVVFSWDNLMTHPVMHTRPDHLAVWNEHMVEQARAFHFYPADRVHVVGPPHFDHYQDPETFVSRDAYGRGLGLDPAKPIVLIAASDNRYIDNTFVVELLMAAQDRGELPAGTQLVVRPHPLDTSKAFDRFRGDPRVTFDRPARWSDSLRWNPDRDEMRELANTLRHSDVVVNVASTIALEAAILDRPIINVCFSTTQPEEFRKKILEFHYEGHYRPVKEHECSVMAYDQRQLVDGIRGYLAHPERHRAERRLMAESLCHHLDGKASRRIVDLILKMAGGSRR